MSMDRTSPVIFVKAQPSNAGEFAGYASTFGGPPDAYGDIIGAGAFADSLKTHAERDSAPALLWAHDPSEPIGRWLTLKEDRQGLRAEGRLTLGTARGSEAHALMKDGALGLSIGYRVKESKLEGRVRVLTAVDLVEISVTALPANVGARITGVKSRPTNIRDFEAELRDVLGFSKREAKALASRGWPSLTDCDDRSDELEALYAALTAATQQLKGA
jgi:HK97 family phage prohead protease